MFELHRRGRASAPLHRVGRGGVRVLAVLALTLGLIGLTVVPASAHHPELTAPGDCLGKVTWTSTAWGTEDSRARHNDDIRIQRQIGGGDWVEIARGAYNAGNSFTFAGSFTDVAAGTGVRLRAYAQDDWGTDGYHAAGRQYSPVTTVSWPSYCEPPAAPKPTATVEADCDGFKVTLANTEGTADALFTITKPDTTTEQVTVPAGQGPVTRTYPVTEDQERTVSVAADGKTIATKTYTADCVPPAAPKPTATVEASCDGFKVTLANTEGTADAVFTITKPDTTTEQVTVPAGQGPLTRTYPVIEDQDQSVTVTGAGMQDTTESLTAAETDCVTEPPATPAPTADLSVDCNGFVVTLANTDGAADAVFTVVAPDGTSQDVTVPAGQQAAPISFAVTEDVARTVRVLSGGVELRSATYTADCVPPPSTPPSTPSTPPATPPAPAAAPEAAVDADCNGFDVTLTNTDGTADATFTVTGPGGKDREVTVPAGEETSLAFPVTEDEERTVAVSVGGDEIASRSYTADCIKGEEVFRPPAVQGGTAPPAAVLPAAAALPDTGAPAQQWMLLVGLMMVTVGGTLLVSRRRLTS